jgi:hypothetical protein
MVVVAAALAATAAQAREGRITGASIERFGGLARLTAVNFRRTDVGAGRLGPDVAIGFVPEFLRARTLLVDIDAGFAYAAPVGRRNVRSVSGASASVGPSVLHARTPIQRPRRPRANPPAAECITSRVGTHHGVSSLFPIRSFTSSTRLTVVCLMRSNPSRATSSP